MIHSAYITLRDRGFFVLLKAMSWLLIGTINKVLLQKSHIEKRIYNYKMLLDLYDPGISRTLLLFGEREIDHKIMLEKVLKPGMRVFDIGANIGYYPLMELGLIGEAGNLLAIEPSPANVELLKKNLILNGHNNIEVISGAVSDKNGTNRFYLSEFSNLNTFHPTGTGERFVSGETIDVKTFNVPTLAEKYGVPDLIRMDVEGHEVEVINGMIDSIKAGDIKPMIIFETHLTRYDKDHDIKETLYNLFNLGYQAKWVSSSWQKGTKIIEDLGYEGLKPFKTDSVERVLFENISQEHLVDLVSRTGGARTVLLTPGSS